MQQDSGKEHPDRKVCKLHGSMEDFQAGTKWQREYLKFELKCAYQHIAQLRYNTSKYAVLLLGTNLIG